MISLAAGRKVGWDGMGQDRWQGAPFLGRVGLLTGAKTTPPWQMGVAFRSSGSIRGTGKQFLGRQESEARSYCPPLAGSGQTESCIKQRGSSLLPRTEPLLGSFLCLAPAQLFISTTSRPICLWLLLSAVLETGGGRNWHPPSPMALSMTAKQHTEN